VTCKRYPIGEAVNKVHGMNPKRPALLRLALVIAAAFVVVACSDSATVESHLERATTFTQTGDYRAAVIELKGALQLAPENADARWQLGQIYLRVGQGPSALKELEKSQELGKRGVEVSLAIAEARIQSREFDRALGTLATLPRETNPAKVFVLTGDAQLGLGEYEAAQRAYRNALEAEPGNLKAQRGLARVALSQRDFNEAEKQLAVALQTGNEELEAWGLMGQLELMRGNFDAALKAYKFAESIGTLSPGIRFGLIRSYLGLGDAAAADEHIVVLQTASPNHPLVNYYRAVSARIRGQTDEAESALLEVFRIQPNHLQGLLLMGALKLSKGELRQAENSLVKFIDAVPDHLPGRKLLASVYLELGQPADAVEVLEPARAGAAEDAQYLAMLGSALLRNQSYQEGTELLERAAELNPDAVGIRTQLAFSHLVTGSDDKAVETLKSALGVEPEFRRANLLLIFTLLRNKRWDEAIKAAQDLAARQPDDPVPLNLLGSAHAGQGDKVKAREQFEKALKLKGDFHSATLNIARLDLDAGNTEAAAQRYESILKVEPGQEQAAIGLARIVEERGDQEETDRLLQMARTNNKFSLGPRLILANRYLRQGRLEEASRVADEADEIAPRNPAVRRVQARVQAGRGAYGRAKTIYLELSEKAPEDAQLIFELAFVQVRDRDPQSATASLQRVLKIDPKHVGAQVALGEMAVRDGRFDDGLDIADKLATNNPDNASGLVLRGDTLLTSGDATGAAAAYREAQTVAKSTRIVLKLFTSLRMAGDGVGGRKVLEQWLKDNPDDGAVRLALATEDHGKGEVQTAMDAYEKVLEASPNNFVALNNLAWLYFDREDPRALEFAEKAHELAGRRPDVADTYGWMLVQFDQVEKGLGILERAARAAPDQMEIRYHLAAALNRVGDTERAKKLLETVLASGQAFATKQDARELYISLK
jgi:putative PEP-CTERM system TPR-repeat lipoprotein